MPGPVCCLLAVCCPPPQQLAALKEHFMSKGLSEEHATQAAEAIAPELRAAAAEMKPVISRKRKKVQ